MQSFSGNQKLVQGDTEYDAEDFLWATEAIASEELNPGVSVETIIAFDLAPGFDPSGATLQLHDSAFSGGVEVQIP
jgi:hypothetical protein